MRAIFRSELEALGYGLGGWFRRAGEGGYTLGRSKPWGVLLGVLAFMVVAETAVLHVALAQWSAVAAWIATATSVYALVWLAGDYHAWRLHPLRIEGGELRVRLGLRWRLAVPLAWIAGVERVDGAPQDALDLGVMGANVVLGFDRPVRAHGLLGIVREVRRVALTVDDADGLVAAVRAKVAP